MLVSPKLEIVVLYIIVFLDSSDKLRTKQGSPVGNRPFTLKKFNLYQPKTYSVAVTFEPTLQLFWI